MAASTSTISLVRLSFFRSEENVFAFTDGLEISFCFEVEGGHGKIRSKIIVDKAMPKWQKVLLRRQALI